MTKSIRMIMCLVVLIFLVYGNRAFAEKTTPDVNNQVDSIDHEIEVSGLFPKIQAALESSHPDLRPLLGEKTSGGLTILMICARQDLLDCVKIALDQGARIEERDNDGMTALYIAAGSGSLDVLKVLLARGADPNALTKQGDTALDLATMNGYVETARYLLTHGAKVTAPGPDSLPPLFVAALADKPEIIKLLIKNGADPAVESPKGATPLMLALLMDKGKAVKVLAPYARTELDFYTLANYYASNKDTARARKVMKKAIALFPKSGREMAYMGDIALDIGDRSTAKELYRKGLRFVPDQEEAWESLASIYRGEKDYRNAYDCISKATGLKGSDSGTWGTKGDILLRMGKVEKAKESFGKALELVLKENAKDPSALNLVDATWYAIFVDSLDKAVKYADQGISLDATQSYLYVNRGHAELLQGKTDKAQSDYLLYFEKARSLGEEKATKMILDDFFLLERRYPGKSALIEKAKNRILNAVNAGKGNEKLQGGGEESVGGSEFLLVDEESK